MIFCFAFGAVSIKQKRGITTEPIVFEVVIHEPCESYLNATLDSIQISRIQNNPTCLPINSCNPSVDINDFQAHIFCHNIDGGRSVFRFHEIFNVSEAETPTLGDQFIVSWIVPHRFREAKNEYTYKRRPVCTIENDTCSIKQIVNDCYDKPVDIDGTYVDSKDRIYMIPPGITVGTCYLAGACCPYVSLTDKGICGGVGDPCQGVNCDDGNPCTTDTCSGGTCNHANKVCTSNNICDVNPTCNTTTGNCQFDTKVCSDNNACTDNDYCDHASQTCLGGNFITCPTASNCNYALCDAVQGCIIKPLDCGDNNTCTKDSCDVSTGLCTYTQFCTSPIFCQTGNCTNKCIPGVPCPQDDGTQTPAVYCDFFNKCPYNYLCTSTCCTDAGGICKCNPGSLTLCIVPPTTIPTAGP